MLSPAIMRKVFWAGAAFNAVAAVILAFPSRLGPVVELPQPGSIFYAWLLSLFIALFAAAYVWLALQPTYSRPLVTLAAFGKTGVFVVGLACFLRGDIPLATFLVNVGDLAFGLIFFQWLWSSRLASGA